MTEPFACENLNCKRLLSDTLNGCEETHCPFAWQRRGQEDRARDAERDRREAEVRREG
jgi:hypothetical protein